MHYYEVLIADGQYKSSLPLTYSSEELLPNLSIVSVPLRNRNVTGYIVGEATNPAFAVKPIKSRLSEKPLPYHCIQLAEWMRDYYVTSFGDVLRQFAPAAAVVRRGNKDWIAEIADEAIDEDETLTSEQAAAVEKIIAHPSTTVLLHGETGSGKTRVYLELAKRVTANGRSVVILTPEIALTSQLAAAAASSLETEVIVLHSELGVAERKRIWFKLLETTQPMVVIGPRSALFAPIENLGLIIVDEEHEPAYKQEQAPRYHAVRVASQLGFLTGSRVVLGSATPSIADYFIAVQKDAVVEMGNQAKTGKKFKVKLELIDLKDKSLFRKNGYLSDLLISEINSALAARKQILIYYNRRGSARVIMCNNCGWQMLCPNCDIPLVYHADEHLARCHICGYNDKPPAQCPTCANPDIIYKTIGSKALHEIIQKLFPSARVARFDSDNLPGERINEVFQKVKTGEIDILVGTQLVAKGLDLPNLGLVGVINAETSLSLPDFSAEERTYQLLYQVIGRTGRSREDDRVIIQSFDPSNAVIQAAAKRDWPTFYTNTLKERQSFRFPPFSYLLKAVCRRATIKGAENAAANLKRQFLGQGLNVEVIGPTPSFYGRRGKYYYYQLVVKSKDRGNLIKLAALAPSGWTFDLDPVDLL